MTTPATARVGSVWTLGDRMVMVVDVEPGFSWVRSVVDGDLYGP